MVKIVKFDGWLTNIKTGQSYIFIFVHKDLGFYFHLRKYFFWLEILERHPHHEFTVYLARIFAHFFNKN